MALVAAASWSAVLAQSSDSGLYLFQIPSELAEIDAPAGGPGAYFDLYLTDTAALIENAAMNSRLQVVDVGEDVVRIRLSAVADESPDEHSAYTKSTFVVDYEQAPVEELVAGLRSEHGTRPRVSEIVDFVGHKIGTKTYRHGFRIASEVAVRLEGDCTEHAVLTAAVARAVEMPARVAFGILVIADGSELHSFGHAWAEIFDGEAWRIADATWPERVIPDADLHHIGLSTLENEGPGFAMDLMRLAVVQPSRLTLLSAAAQ